jgi:hypothetical protein
MKYLPAIIFIMAFFIGFSSSNAQDYFSSSSYDNSAFSPHGSQNSLILPEEYHYLVRAPEFVGMPDSNAGHSVLPDSTVPDTIPHPVKRKLLPDNMSFVERGLWGEHGVFRKIGIISDLTPESRKHELGIRRTMLVAHQIGGFVALGSMITACYFGQRILDGNPGYRTNHEIAVTASIISYSATGLLAVLSPPPMIRRDEVSTTTIHKELAWIHFAGMVLTPILGGMIKHRTYDQQAHFHQISAYITTAAMAASMITVTF